MTTELMPDLACQVDLQIRQCNYNVRANFLKMAELLVKMRDEKLYHALDYHTFESYLGSISAEGTRGWLYKLIRAWEVFSKKMEIPDQTLIAIGPSKLDIIAPMAPAMMLDDQHKADWIGKAAELSKSDLINEVRICQGKPLLSSLPVPPEFSTVERPGLTDLVKSCVICGSLQVDAHHFPITRGAGCPPNWTIPLCRQDHQLFHQNPKEWMWENRRLWASYFYGFILKTRGME